ncbi:MAG: efflux RND transporter periplasmic adaptor subunit [Bacteroidales bacterium]|jgi:multidrug efflux system membrane fusion protein|nr:efflux RND transporter periplasmic adaptor subunit [Bacteroidales bacterium]
MKLYQGILLALLFVACNRKEEAKEVIRPVYYQKIAESAATDIRKFAGVSQAKNEAKLSFKVGGTLEKRYFKLGERVQKGELIAYLDSEDYKINYNKALSSKKNAEVQTTAAKSSYERIENLYGNNNASLNDFEKAKAQYESALAMLNISKSQLIAAENQISYTKLLAPHSGSISKILAQENEMVGPGMPILIFSSDKDIELTTFIPENLIKQIKIGQKVKVSFSALDNQFLEGEISEFGLSSSRSSSYPLIIKLTEQNAQILPGMACSIEIGFKKETSVSEFIVVPADAVAHDDGGDFVYVIKKTDDKDIYLAERRSVTLGKLLPKGYEIKKGLNTEDNIITAGLSFMYDGRRVSLVKK